MFTPTAFMKPTITALETKRSIEPSRSSPASSITTPVSSDRVTSARAGSLELSSASTSEISIAIAPVACTAMKVELVASAPAERADHVGVQAVDRVDAGQQAGGEPVGHRLHTQHQAGDRVAAQVPATRQSSAPGTRLVTHPDPLKRSQPPTPVRGVIAQALDHRPLRPRRAGGASALTSARPFPAG